MMKHDADISRLVDFLESSPQMGETLIVCHASYESDRANSTIGALLSSSSSPKISHAILVGTKESMVALQSYRDCFEGLSEKLTKLVGIKPAAIAVSRPNLIDMTRAIHESIGERLTKSIESVIVDASVFPKDRLWMVLDYFKRINSRLKLFVSYTEPKQYSTEVEPDGWLSKGVKRLIRVPGFNGHQNPSKKSLLVVIVGHEIERMQITIKNIEPQKIVLVGQGIQQHGDATPQLPKRIADKLGNDYAGIVDISGSIEIGSRAYRETQSSIQNIFARYSDEYNMTVAGNGTKLQSLGALLACQENRAIAAVYAEPQIYNASDYSSGTGGTWILQL